MKAILTPIILSLALFALALADTIPESLSLKLQAVLKRRKQGRCAPCCGVAWRFCGRHAGRMARRSIPKPWRVADVTFVEIEIMAKS